MRWDSWVWFSLIGPRPGGVVKLLDSTGSVFGVLPGRTVDLDACAGVWQIEEVGL